MERLNSITTIRISFLILIVIQTLNRICLIWNRKPQTWNVAKVNIIPHFLAEWEVKCVLLAMDAKVQQIVIMQVQTIRDNER